MLKSPSAIFFSIAFPLIFICAFGLMSNGGYKVDVVFDKQSDTLNYIYQSLKHIPVVNVLEFDDSLKQQEEFNKGKIAAMLNIQLLSEKQPSLQFVTPEQLGDLAVFLCTPAANQVRGVAWNVDGGWVAQ